MSTRLRNLLVVALLGVVALSCDEPYRSHFYGTWESISFVQNGIEYSIGYGDYETYSFFDDGTGIYTNELGGRMDFYWDEYDYDQLKLRYFNGETVWVYYRFDRGDLLMTRDASWWNYWVYRYTSGRYY